MKSPLKWYGGKGRLASWIVSHLPPHHIYVEPFGGGASVLFAKDPSPVEVYNDLNKKVHNFFQVLRVEGDEFIRRATLTPYSEFEFHLTEYTTPSEMQCALDDFIRWRQSFSAKGDTWSYTTRRSRRGMANNVSAWLSAVDGLPEVVERLRRVEFHNKDVFDIFPLFDTPDTLFYLDPPYVGVKNEYDCGFSDKNHEQLVGVIKGCTGHVCLSGYPNPVYDRLGWRTVTKPTANHAAGGKTKRIMQETLWMNYEDVRS